MALTLGSEGVHGSIDAMGWNSNSTVALTLGSEGCLEADVELNGGVGLDIRSFFGINKTTVCINSTHTNYFLLPFPK